MPGIKRTGQLAGFFMSVVFSTGLISEYLKAIN
jgi:hypothetical protein